MDVTLEKWKKTIGILPKGFSISIESGELQLHYCEKWERPILVCSHYVGNIAENAIVERASVTRFLTSNVGNFQRDKLGFKKGKTVKKEAKANPRKIARKRARLNQHLKKPKEGEMLK